MPINEKDAQILQHIVNYCQQITLTVDFWGNEPKQEITAPPHKESGYVL